MNMELIHGFIIKFSDDHEIEYYQAGRRRKTIMEKGHTG
jgi:hypothetical protein